MPEISQSSCRGLLSLVVLALLAIPASAQPPADLTIETVITGVTAPTAMRHAGDGSGRLFIVERAGVIRVWDGQSSTPLATPFLDISSDVQTGGEEGMLGLAFHPDYASNGFFYVSYTGIGSISIIERFTVSADPNVADLASRSVVLSLAQTYSNHNGGDIHFGPDDGYLYIGFGDGGGFDTPQDMTRILGKMLRIDVDSPPAEGAELCAIIQNYAIPPDNPFVATSDDCDEIWHSGLRNPWRWSFDRATGDMLIGDVGEDSAEEVNFQPAESTGGENWGWPCREGSTPFEPGFCTGGETLIDPVLEYSHAGGQCSVIGGYVYRGSIAGMFGTYVYADWCTGEIWFANETSPGVWSTSLWNNLDDFSYIGFGEDEAGELYVTQFDAVGRFSSASAGTLIFADGFELFGDTSQWSSVVPIL